MPYHVAYAVDADSNSTVSDAIEETTGFVREGHESSYLGVYDLFRVPDRVMVKYNVVDEEWEWDDPEHRNRAVLVVAEQTDRPTELASLVNGLGLDAVLVEQREW